MITYLYSSEYLYPVTTGIRLHIHIIVCFPMRKTPSILEEDLTKSSSGSTRAWIHSQGDSMKSISDCTTVVSELDFMEETSQQHPSHNLETSFRKQMNSSVLQGSVCNPNIKKSRILVMESRIIQDGGEERPKGLNREMEELESIERKTQDLVAKEREQRRELKKLKKMYVQKLDELVKQEQTHFISKNQLNHTINTLLNEKTQLIKEKEAIQQTMTRLQGEAARTREEIKSIRFEKEDLTHRVQLFESHFKERSTEENAAETQTVLDLDRQIGIIDKSIAISKKNGCEKDIHRFLELKIQLIEKRQSIKIKQQAYRHARTISHLNEIISSRNNLLRSKNKTISQLESQAERHQYQQKGLEKEKELQTAQSFYSKANQECVLEQDDETRQWDQFKKSVRNLIDCNRIMGHQQSYEAIQCIVLGMIHLFQNETCCEEDVLELLDISLDHLNTKYASKAKLQVSKIQRLLQDIIPEKGVAKVHLKQLKDKENVLYEKKK